MTWPRAPAESIGQPADATSPPSVQCLFCSHLNPADASYCNDCGSQLHLQPCERCGVLNLRSARNCYKCGADLTLQAVPAPHPPSAVQANQFARTGVSDAVLTKQQTPVPDVGPRSVVVTRATEAGATAASQRSWWAATAAILLATVAMAGYYLFERSPELRQRLGANPSEPRTGTPSTPEPIAKPAPVVVPEPPQPAPAGAVQPSPVSEAGGIEPQDSGRFKDCPDAVVALGLCIPNQKRKEQ